MTLYLENGNKLAIEAPGNNKQNIYIQDVKLNGRLIDRNFIRHDELLEGGKLIVRMGPEPEKNRGISENTFPFSMSRN